MYQELWDLESFVSYWRNLFSKLYDGSSEVCYLKKMHLGKFPHPDEFQCWSVNFKTEECASTPFPQLTMSWIPEVEMARSIDDLITSQSIEGRRDFSDFDILDARIASALRKIIFNTSLKGESVLKSSEFKNTFDSWEGDNLPTWFMTTFEQPETMMQRKTYQTFSYFGDRMMTFKISTQDGIKRW